MKKIQRGDALAMYANLGTMALGYMDEKMLVDIMTNFNALRKVADDFDALKTELVTRLYGDKNSMTEEEKKTIGDFFRKVNEMASESKERKAELANLIRKDYPELYATRKKEVSIINALIAKDVEIDIVEVGADEFIQGVVRGKKDAMIHEIMAVFSPMFKENKEKKGDFSELDEFI